MTDMSLPNSPQSHDAALTHGRHCSCSACAREDWPKIAAPCGMHGPSCPAVYAPIAARIFDSPADALAWPRSVVTWLVRHRERLGLPEPDPYWYTTAQVRWADPKPPSFLVRVWCLYAGHDMQAVQVKDGYLGRRLDCQRCGWEGPWL